jgi:hypothetical protein
MIRTLTFRGTGHSPLWVYTLYAMHSRMHKENVGSSLHGREYSRQRRSSGELSP